MSGVRSIPIILFPEGDHLVEPDATFEAHVHLDIPGELDPEEGHMRTERSADDGEEDRHVELR